MANIITKNYQTNQPRYEIALGYATLVCGRTNYGGTQIFKQGHTWLIADNKGLLLLG